MKLFVTRFFAAALALCALSPLTWINDVQAQVGTYPGRQISTGNGVTTVFPYSFRILTSADLEVRLDGVLQSSGYTVSGIGAASGGNITFSSAPGNGVQVLRQRVATFNRSTDYQRGGAFSEETVDNDFDRAIMLAQQLDDRLGRTLRAPATDTAYPSELPSASARASSVLGFDATGQPTTYSAASAVTDATSITFLQSGTGAVSRTLQDKGRDTLNAKDFGVKCDNVTNDSAAAQLALDAATGKTLVFPPGRCKLNTAVTLPSNIVIQGGGPSVTLLVTNAAAGLISATSKTNITFRDIGFTGAGFSNVPTFTLSSKLAFDNVLCDGQHTANVQSSTCLRFYGSTHITIHASRFLDYDSAVYLDKSGATNSDLITVSNSHFEHTFLGTGNNPTGVYGFNANHITVEGSTFKNIVPGGGSPIAGYGLYVSDGTSSSSKFIGNTCINTYTTSTRAMVCHLDLTSLNVVTANNSMTAGAGSASFLADIGAASTPVQGDGHVVVNGNMVSNAAIRVYGGGTAATAARFVNISNNVLHKMESGGTAPIRVGFSAAYYAGHVEIAGNLIFAAAPACISVTEAAFVNIHNNKLLNCNTGNGQGQSVNVYLDAIAFYGSVLPYVGRVTNNVISNSGTPTGYARYAVSCDAACPNVYVEGNTISGMVTGSVLNTRAVDSPVYASVATTTFNYGARGQQRGTDRIVVGATTPIFSAGGTGGSVGATGGLLVCNAYETAVTTKRFIDIVAWQDGVTPVVVSSVNSGVPSSRTYSYSAGAVQIAISGSVSYTISCSSLEQPN